MKMRGFAACSKLRPNFTGGKLKQYSGFKERFKLTGTGKPEEHTSPLEVWHRHGKLRCALLHFWHLQLASWRISPGHVPGTPGMGTSLSVHCAVLPAERGQQSFARSLLYFCAAGSQCGAWCRQDTAHEDRAPAQKISQDR